MDAHHPPAAEGPPVRRPRSARGRARAVSELLAAEFPRYRVPLDHRSAFQLLAATILSAQCTDAMVNRVTPALFARYPDAATMAAAPVEDLEALIRPTGFFRSKARSLLGMSSAVAGRFGGDVPGRMEDLITLPGVGRKTASVILGHWFGVPAIPVDTHVLRLSARLGLSEATDPERVERDLAGLLPRRDWTDTSMRLIFHGRRTCTARAPRCGACVLAGFCPSARRPTAPRGPRAPARR